MELINSLKSLFTRNTAAASTSGAKIPILNSAGEVIGSDNMANLAAVLGGLKEVNLSDFNNVGNEPFIAFVASSGAANAPFSGVLRGYILSKSVSGYSIQIYIESNNTNYRGKIFTRTSVNTEWTSWRQI